LGKPFFASEKDIDLSRVNSAEISWSSRAPTGCKLPEKQSQHLYI